MNPTTRPGRHVGRCSGRSPDQTAKPQASGGVIAPGNEDPFRVLVTRENPTSGLARALHTLRGQLSPRDLAIIATLAALRLATTGQLQRLHFTTGSARTRGLRTRRTLARLHALGLVSRHGRNIGGTRPGSTPNAHYLTPDGQRLAGVRPGRPERFLDQRDHTLATTELAVVLSEAHQARALELVHFETEPVCWRSFTIDGNRRYLRPDAFTIIGIHSWELLWYIELDRGTQNLAVIRRKARAYHDYATTGREQNRWGVFPRVAYLTTGTDTRRAALTRTLAATPDADQLVTVAPLNHATTTLTTTKEPQ